ncbi:solid-state culture-specific protein-like protein [Clohesyomyces aquaticus]|uniref:Solid-state culture-specific protein-like protein n=1 Tax=Clohesyomyces aquaticus TaxID=1231657 RepID=A0A1Y1ZTL1_9PLEO|nr:solid-state culture-specific protein-like protein [Clohesyomyces aquaticus]
MSPKVELTTTLADLYSLDGGNTEDVSLVYAFPNPTQIAASLPVSHKYAYQGPRTVKWAPDTLARICLSCLPQYYGFIAGPMDLYLFDLDNTKMEMFWGTFSWQKPELWHRFDAKRVHQDLQASQRPRLHFVEDSKTLAALDRKKAVITPIDFLDGNNPLVDQDAHWNLLSKRTLALSDLPSPPTEVIDCNLRTHEKDDKEAIKRESDRMLDTIASRPLPFVVKLPMGMGGHAVFLVNDEEKRNSCLTILRDELPSMFQSLTPENEANTPVSLLLQQVVPGPSDGVSIFITKAGRPIYISTSEQILDERDQWTGGFMDYSRQEALGKKYHDTIQKVAKYVYDRGYYGPMGVDVMTDENGQQLIVDMNIRQTGSYTLGLMKKHFYEQRNLSIGGLCVPLGILGDRDSFEKRFSKEIEDGSMVIAAWCRGKAGPGAMFTWSAVGLLLGAKTREEMEILMDRLDKLRAVK